jgi:hypothetical protein
MAGFHFYNGLDGIRIRSGNGQMISIEPKYLQLQGLNIAFERNMI